MAKRVRQNRVTLKPTESKGFRKINLEDQKKAPKGVQNPPPILGVQHDAGEHWRANPPPPKEETKATFKTDGPKKWGWPCHNPLGSRIRDTLARRWLCFAPFLCARNHYRNRSKRYKIESGHILGTRFYPGERFLPPDSIPTIATYATPSQMDPFLYIWCTLWQTTL